MSEQTWNIETDLGDHAVSPNGTAFWDKEVTALVQTNAALKQQVEDLQAQLVIMGTDPDNVGWADHEAELRQADHDRASARGGDIETPSSKEGESR